MAPIFIYHSDGELSFFAFDVTNFNRKLILAHPVLGNFLALESEKDEVRNSAEEETTIESAPL